VGVDRCIYDATPPALNASSDIDEVCCCSFSEESPEAHRNALANEL